MSQTSTTLMDDRFELIERIGAGGMGEVWRATDRIAGRQVAVKRLLEHSPAHAERLMREAQLLAREREGIARSCIVNTLSVVRLSLSGTPEIGYSN